METPKERVSLIETEQNAESVNQLKNRAEARTVTFSLQKCAGCSATLCNA